MGEVASGFSVVSRIPEIDYLSELAFPAYIEEFKRLLNDPAIAKGLRSNTFPIINADWSVEPASDDPRDVMIAEFVGANLYQQEGDYFGRQFWTRTAWPLRLRDILRFLGTGFSIFQKVYRTEGRFVIFDTIKYLQPESIMWWQFDATDQLVSITRNYTGADGQVRAAERIDASELFVYTWDQEGSNILGRPLIRPTWMDFNIKSRAKKLGIIDKQKTAVGVPYFKNAAGDGVEDEKRGDRIAKAMRSGNYERLWARIKEGQDFGWKEGGQSTKGLPDIVRLSNEEISGVLGDRFLDLGFGSSTGGSRGVAGTGAAFSALMQSAIVKVVIAYELMLSRELVDLNWPAGSVGAYPHPKCTDVDPFEKVRTLPDIMSNMGPGKAITKTFDTENEIRRRYELMELDEKQYDELNTPTPQPPSDGSVPVVDAPRIGDGSPAGPAKDSGAGPAQGDPSAPRASQGRRRRLSLDVQRVLASARIDPEVIRRELERIEAIYYGSLRHVQRDMRDAIVTQIRGGLVPRKASDVKVPFQEELKQRLIAIRQAARDFGRERLEEELKRQLHALSRRPIANPVTRRAAIASSNEQAQVLSALDVTNLVARLQSQTVAEYHRLVAQNASPSEVAAGLESYLASISDREIAAMARTATSLAFNQGRNVAILEHRAQLGENAVRVELEDENTCEPCSELDGKQFTIGSPEYFANQPPAHCLGKLRCRGFMVVQAKGLEAAA